MRRLVFLFLVAACDKTAAEAGKEAFEATDGFSNSGLNEESCASCHATTPNPGNRIDSGYNLYGVLNRPTYWGARQLSPISAANQCIVYFLRGRDLDPESDQARELYEFFASISPPEAPAESRPWTVIENLQPLPRGDTVRGEDLYARACAQCHGELHTGAGRRTSDIVLPEDILDDWDTMFPNDDYGRMMTEKIRHGRFFLVGGVMPPFSTEVLSDEDVSDLLEAMGTCWTGDPAECQGGE